MAKHKPDAFMVIMRQDGKALGFERGGGATVPFWSHDLGLAERYAVPEDMPHPPWWYVGPHQRDLTKDVFMAIVQPSYDVVAKLVT